LSLWPATTKTTELDQPTKGHRYGLTAQDGAAVSANRAHDTVLKASTPVGIFIQLSDDRDGRRSLVGQGSVYVLDVTQSKQVCLQSIIPMFILSESVFISYLNH